MHDKKQIPPSAGRRDFIKNSTAVIGGSLLAAAIPLHLSAHGGSRDNLNIALIGCGGRGSGAVVNALSTKGNVSLIAMADVFRDKLDEAYNNLSKINRIKDLIHVPEQNKFTGFDAYEKVLALKDVDLVLLVTPPAFRPIHFEAAVQAGKHVFMEKPLACDAPGIRKILATGELAGKKNIKVVVGLQNRYDPGYIDMVRQLKEGVIGDIVSASDYYLIGPIHGVERSAGQTEMEYQMRNWRYFNWLWAGSPAGLQIHNTDVVNWVKGSYPVRAQGIGGRSSLSGPNDGDIFDHFFIEYEYADGTKLNSQIRSIAGTWNKGGSFFQGSKGTAGLQEGIRDNKGGIIWRNKNKDSEGAYQIEHDQLFAAIRNNTPINDTEWAAMSTMTTILGRMAAHSGKMVEWDDAFQSEYSALPAKFAWNADPPVMPDQNGNYAVPMPGKSIIF
ncbi:MAG TPA: Gfo/Idh/MocA family oxidoreductase [Puia sp.]|nr:Gfo/Idh/MocA family oxidoreductase [Puia sp.]